MKDYKQNLKCIHHSQGKNNLSLTLTIVDLLHDPQGAGVGRGHETLEAALPEAVLTSAPAQPPQLGGDPPPHPGQGRLHDVHQIPRVILRPLRVLRPGPCPLVPVKIGMCGDIFGMQCSFNTSS